MCLRCKKSDLISSLSEGRYMYNFRGQFNTLDIFVKKPLKGAYE